jgi:hypothetical protein
MKIFITSICCLLLVGALNAAPEENQHKKKNAGQGQQQAQPQGQIQKAGKPGKHLNGPVNQNVQFRKNQGDQGMHVKKVHGNADAQLSNAGQGTHTGAAKAERHAANLQAKANAGQFKVKKFQFQNGPKAGIASAKFKANNHIEGSQNLNGQKYVAFKNYHSQWHDRNWWHHHHNRIVFVFGSPYYWDSGYWYPAWGYDPGTAYYPYDGPIYGYNGLPPDQVIANVQASLQAQGYYEGEVDGLLGPLTRAALANYQRDHGLYTTAAIDEPTLDSLGMG